MTELITSFVILVTLNLALSTSVSINILTVYLLFQISLLTYTEPHHTYIVYGLWVDLHITIMYNSTVIAQARGMH